MGYRNQAISIITIVIALILIMPGATSALTYEYRSNTRIVHGPGFTAITQPFPTVYNKTTAKWEKSNITTGYGSYDATINTQGMNVSWGGDHINGFTARVIDFGLNVSFEPQRFRIYDPVEGVANICSMAQDPPPSFEINNTDAPNIKYSNIFNKSTSIYSGLASYLIDTPPTIDGNIQNGEWDSATTYLVNETKRIQIYICHDSTYTYVGVSGLDDPTDDSFYDDCFIYFDTDHGQEASPQADDYRFNIEGNNNTIGNVGGMGWGGSISFTGKTSMAHGYRTYEYQINNNYVDNDKTEGDIFGFGVYLNDANGPYAEHHTYFPDDYSTPNPVFGYENPNQWGDCNWSNENRDDWKPQVDLHYFPTTYSMNKLYIIKEGNATEMWNQASNPYMQKSRSYLEIFYEVNTTSNWIYIDKIGYNNVNPLITDDLITFYNLTYHSTMQLSPPLMTDAVMNETNLNYRLYPFDSNGNGHIGILVKWFDFENQVLPLSIDPQILFRTFDSNNYSRATPSDNYGDMVIGIEPNPSSNVHWSVYNNSYDEINGKAYGIAYPYISGDLKEWFSMDTNLSNDRIVMLARVDSGYWPVDHARLYVLNSSHYLLATHNYSFTSLPMESIVNYNRLHISINGSYCYWLEPGTPGPNGTTGNIHLINLTSGNKSVVYNATSGQLFGIDITSNGTIYFSNDQYLYKWFPGKSPYLLWTEPGGQTIYSIDIAPDDSQIMMGSYQAIYRIKNSTGQIQAVLTATGNIWFDDFAWRNNTFALSVTNTGQVRSIESYNIGATWYFQSSVLGTMAGGSPRSYTVSFDSMKETAYILGYGGNVGQVFFTARPQINITGPLPNVDGVVFLENESLKVEGSFNRSFVWPFSGSLLPINVTWGFQSWGNIVDKPWEGELAGANIPYGYYTYDPVGPYFPRLTANYSAVNETWWATINTTNYADGSLIIGAIASNGVYNVPILDYINIQRNPIPVLNESLTYLNSSTEIKGKMLHFGIHNHSSLQALQRPVMKWKIDGLTGWYDLGAPANVAGPDSYWKDDITTGNGSNDVYEFNFTVDIPTYPEGNWSLVIYLKDLESFESTTYFNFTISTPPTVPGGPWSNATGGDTGTTGSGPGSDDTTSYFIYHDLIPWLVLIALVFIGWRARGLMESGRSGNGGGTTTKKRKKSHVVKARRGPRR